MKIKKAWKRNGSLFAAAFLLSGICGTQAALAEGQPGPSTNVWIDVIQKPTQDRICVTVPMAYGFVVVGSEDTQDETPISVENGNLLLPNVKVEVEDDLDADGLRDYSLTVFGNMELPIKNYSTTVPDDAEEEEEERRVGLAVKLGAYMDARNDGGLLPPPDRAYWELSEEKPGIDADSFKKYRMVLDGKAFRVLGGEDQKEYHMDGTISLGAPPDVEHNGWTAAGTANVPKEQYVTVDVEVGGGQGNYTQVEQSVKISTIHWEVEADFPEEEP